MNPRSSFIDLLKNIAQDRRLISRYNRIPGGGLFTRYLNIRRLRSNVIHSRTVSWWGSQHDPPRFILEDLLNDITLFQSENISTDFIHEEHL